jgi:phage terminase large subunit-like protein
MSPGITIKIPDYHPNQQTIRRNLDRFNVLCCGRRYGKDIFGQNWTIEGLLRGYPMAWYLPSFKDLLENWRYFVDTLYPITTRKNEQDRRLDFITGGSLEMWSLEDHDASRGRHYKRIVVNEAGFIPMLEYSWNAAIRATLLQDMGSALIMGTPKGMNYYHSLYRRGLNKEHGWKSFHRTSYDNPTIPASEIDEIKATAPELYFRQEYMAEFVDMEGSVFRRIQEAATVEQITEPVEGRQYVAGVDVAASVDYTVVTVFDVAAKSLVFIDRFNRVDYNVLEDRLQATYNRWHLQSMSIEANSIGQPVLDALNSRGMNIIPFTTTSATKQTIIAGLQSAFEHGEIKIINDPVLIGELLSFEGKRSPSGSFTYSAPAGMHDDCVMSLAIGWDALSGSTWLDMADLGQVSEYVNPWK